MKDYAAESGVALTDDAPSFATIALDRIAPSLTNPRKTFDAVKLQDLADSIKASGMHQPVLVRSLPGSRMADTDRTVQYELVVGERRLRASLLAGMATIPAMIRALTDDQVMEIQIIENLQRDDLSALEEAEGYEQLCAATGIRKEDIGAKIGKSRSYVYAKLKLLDLCQEGKQALRDGSIDASRALLIARVPDSKLQIKALAEATRAGYGGEVPSVRALSQWLVQNVMLKLEHAPFQITDAHLVEAAGSCKECPKRTGAAPDLFSDVDGADICTDPACYAGKTEAHRTQTISIALRKGMRLVDGAEAKEIIPHIWNSGSGMLVGYTRLDQQRDDVLRGESVSLRALLAGEDLPGNRIEAILIEHPRTKELIEAVPTAETEALLITRGLVREVQAENTDPERAEAEIKYLKDRMDSRIAHEGRQAVWQALVKAVHTHAAPGMLLTAELARAWLLDQCQVVNDDDLVAAFNLPDIQGGESMTDRAINAAQRAGDAALWRAVVILMMSADQPSSYFGSSSNDKPAPLFDAVAQAVKLDVEEVMAEAKKAVKEDIADKIRAIKASLKPAKAKPALPPKPHAPAAPAGGVAAIQGGRGSKTKSADVPPRKPKTSASEAKAQIAAAMQAEDQKTVPGAAAQGSEAASGFALAVGARVTVLPSARGPKAIQWVGQSGTVLAKTGPAAWDVCFTPATAKAVTRKNAEHIVGFHETELGAEA